MSYETIRQFSKMLRNLAGCLEKGASLAQVRKFEPNNLLAARLAPDMFTLGRQVQIACDTARLTASRLSGKEASKQEENEKTISELLARIDACVSYLEGFKPEDFKDAESRRVQMPRAEGKYLTGKDYLREFAVPNFYFHVATAYGLLRHDGIELGKRDFLGPLPFQDG